MKRGFLKDILRSNQSVFSLNELCLLWPAAEPETIKSRVNYYKKSGDLYAIKRGLYAKDAQYNKLELATKLYTPSYISFETVLVKAGIIFQHYEQIFVATYQSKTVKYDKQEYVFRKLKSSILTNTLGIDIKDYYSIASTERAFLDMLYLHKDYYFDNLAPLNWDKIDALLPIYNNNRMEKVIARLKKE